LAYAEEITVSEARQVRLFRNGRNQAVRIPVEFELPGEAALMHREGNRLVIEPIRKGGLLALISSWEPIADEFPDVDRGTQVSRDVDL
jgi:antitoxin VapB